ncbi:Hypothetical protein NTJ_16196 [Nesidiocoris tenuis]|uniref:THAP-type domain-containing protein n=1 Tax=Nesidiocoris tenuis TaxID=355587 RepID=A0ABN7BGB6_9HEMI|nr:Hypothetical protein NTJ_16196 [Nesidiocoris tenuis]
MVTKCVVPNCGNSCNAKLSVALFSFPKNPSLAKVWQTATRAKATTKDGIKSHHKVCSDHFEDRFVLKQFGATRLKPGAIPTIFEWNSKQPKNLVSLGQMKDSVWVVGGDLAGVVFSPPSNNRSRFSKPWAEPTGRDNIFLKNHQKKSPLLVNLLRDEPLDCEVILPDSPYQEESPAMLDDFLIHEMKEPMAVDPVDENDLCSSEFLHRNEEEIIIEGCCLSEDDSADTSKPSTSLPSISLQPSPVSSSENSKEVGDAYSDAIFDCPKATEGEDIESKLSLMLPEIWTPSKVNLTSEGETDNFESSSSKLLKAGNPSTATAYKSASSAPLLSYVIQPENVTPKFTSKTSTLSQNTSKSTIPSLDTVGIISSQTGQFIPVAGALTNQSAVKPTGKIPAPRNCRNLVEMVSQPAARILIGNSKISSNANADIMRKETENGRQPAGARDYEALLRKLRAYKVALKRKSETVDRLKSDKEKLNRKVNVLNKALGKLRKTTIFADSSAQLLQEATAPDLQLWDRNPKLSKMYDLVISLQHLSRRVYESIKTELTIASEETTNGKSPPPSPLPGKDL